MIIKPERVVDQDHKFDPKGNFLRAFTIIPRLTFERHMLDIITDEMWASAADNKARQAASVPKGAQGFCGRDADGNKLCFKSWTQILDGRDGGHRSDVTQIDGWQLVLKNRADLGLRQPQCWSISGQKNMGFWRTERDYGLFSL